MAPWTSGSSVVRYSRGKLALREDTWQLPDGSERTYPVLVVGPAVAILAFVDDDRVVLVRQYRPLQRGPSWELPGGGVQAGEEPAAAAKLGKDPVAHDVQVVHQITFRDAGPIEEGLVEVGELDPVTGFVTARTGHQRSVSRTMGRSGLRRATSTNPRVSNMDGVPV